jgi:acetylserotonin N-methyltransferase
MSSDETAPDISGIVEILGGFRVSKAMFAAVSLGLFDRLHQSPSTCSELARDLNCAEHALERLLGVCSSKNLITQDADDRFSNIEASERFLRVESPETLAGYVFCSHRMQYRL